MSHRATVWAIDQQLPSLQKLVLIILADRHNNDSNRCDPSLELVAKDCGMSRRSVIRIIQELAKAGLITVIHRKVDTANTSNSYTLNMQVLVGVVSDSHQGVVTDSHLNQEVKEPLNGEDKKPSSPFPAEGEKTALTADKKLNSTSIVHRLFKYYIERTDRHPRLYELTDQRMKKGLARLADCQRKCNGDLGKAEQLMKLAIDGLCESDFHMGKNEQKKQYIDWNDHLFKSTEKLEWWLAR
jgi:DNA-binding Lrp family transcriptional regulator